MKRRTFIQSTINAAVGASLAGSRAALQPLRRFGTVLKDGLKTMSYLQVQGSNTDYRFKSMQVMATEGFYFSTGFVTGIRAELIKTILEGIERNPQSNVFIGFQPGGGAVSRVPNSATAFAHREATHNMLVPTSWPVGEDSTEHMRQAREYWRELQKHTSGFYTNDMTGSEKAATLDANYGKNLPRLAQVKKKYDPGNLFRLNANVKPA